MRAPYRIRALSDSGREAATEALNLHNAGDDDGGWVCRPVSSIEIRTPLALRDYGLIALASIAGFTFAFWLACQ